MPSRRPASAGPTQRQLQIGEELRHAIAQILQRGHFDDELLLLHGPDITVAEVRPSPDLKHATVYVMALGGKDMEALLPALNHAAPYIQHCVGQRVRMKFLPRLKFVTDTTFENAEKIERLLLQIPPAAPSSSDEGSV